MLQLEFSSYLLEIPFNDTYTTLSQNLIGCSTPSPDWLTMENNEKATLTIHMSYRFALKRHSKL